MHEGEHEVEYETEYNAGNEARLMNPNMNASMNSNPNASPNTRVMCFDFGMKRIGVATGNTRTSTSQPLSTVRAKDGTPDWAEVARLIAQWLPATLIIGLPLNMDGSESGMARRARQFGGLLDKRFNRPVVYVDERLSTAAADNLLVQATPPGKSLAQKRHKYRDNLAAELIVRTYLEDFAARV